MVEERDKNSLLALQTTNYALGAFAYEGLGVFEGRLHNFYKAIMQKLDVRKFGLKTTSRIRTFVFKFISVPAKWIRTSRRYLLNIYTGNNAYAELFQTGHG